MPPPRDNVRISMLLPPPRTIQVINQPLHAPSARRGDLPDHRTLIQTVRGTRSAPPESIRARAEHGLGSMGFIAVEGDLDCGDVARDGRPGVEFWWEGHDERDPASGRCWAALNSDGSLDGYLYFYLGDESAFHAVPFHEAP